MRNDARSRLRAQLAESVLALWGQRRQEIVAMVRSCGLEPNQIPLGSQLWREGDRIHLDRFVCDPESGNVIFSEKLQGPLTEEFTIEPESIPHWIPSG